MKLDAIERRAILVILQSLPDGTTRDRHKDLSTARARLELTAKELKACDYDGQTRTHDEQKARALIVAIELPAWLDAIVWMAIHINDLLGRLPAAQISLYDKYAERYAPVLVMGDDKGRKSK